MIRTDLGPKELAELERALLVIRLADKLNAENRGFCMGNEAKARKTLAKYTIED